MAEPRHVPTVEELAHQGLAVLDTRVPKGGVARYRVSDEGHRMMTEAQRFNGLLARAEGERPTK